ncbi:MAG: EipA family protein [Hyphomonadaceae bacterium]
MGAAAGAVAAAAPAWAVQGDYSQDEIVRAAQRFFGAGAEGVAAVVAHVFHDHGRPVGYIEGGEGSGALGVGLRIGDGKLTLLRRVFEPRVYWRGPSIGFDTGGNASRVFTLIYGMTDPNQIFQRFPGVEGSAYFIGGVGVNYQHAEGITLAPMRAGVGLRLGANVGYLAYSRRRYGLPF